MKDSTKRYLHDHWLDTLVIGAVGLLLAASIVSTWVVVW